MIAAVALATATTAGWLAQTLGPAGYDSLKKARYVVVQGEKDAERVQFVHWKALELLAARAQEEQALGDCVRAVSSGKPLPESAPSLAALAELPPEGLMTPSLQTAAQSLAALSARLTTLRSTQTAAGLAARQPALFDEPWGKRFALETGADAVFDPAPLVDPYFQTYLAGPFREPEAERHFTDYAARAFGQKLSGLLSEDAKKGAPSAELRAALGRYLYEQRLLVQAERLEKQLAELAKGRSFRDELAALEAAASALLAHPELLKDLEARPAPAQPETPRPALTSSKLHVQTPTRLGQYELGDTVVVSGSYWVDGLRDGETVPVEETVFADQPAGVRALETSRVKRGNGGPYVYSRKIALTDSREAVFESVVSAPGSNALVERASTPVSKDFELALKKLAAADEHALSCGFKDAPFDALAGQLAAPAKEKPQYAALLNTVLARRTMAARHAAALAEAEALIADSHADASAQACRYDDHKTLKAIEAVRVLPAGCDRYLPELLAQLALIRRRANDQEAFSRATAASRSRRKACEFASAADKAVEALALAEADPEAVCGPLGSETGKLEREAVDARAGEAWRKRFDEALTAAESSKSADEKLAAARGVSARVGSLPDEACFDKERARAEKLASAAGDALEPPAADSLPADDGVAKAAAEIQAERKKTLVSAEPAAVKPAEKQTEKQKPVAVTPKQRLACLEEGFQATNATIDCDGNPFDIVELKRLRDAQAAAPRKPRIKKKPAKKHAPAKKTDDQAQ